MMIVHMLKTCQKYAEHISKANNIIMSNVFTFDAIFEALPFKGT